MLEFYDADNPDADPMEVVLRWIDAAAKLNEPEYEAATLATVDEQQMPDLRIVYVREIDAQGFVFYTNYHSAKGRELESGKAALNYFFPNWRRQIRVRGLVAKVSAAQSDAYFLARPAGSRLGAWMSQQSQPVASREIMETEIEALDPDRANQRPPHWGGYRLQPLQLEFWAMGEHRIHDRFLWKRKGLEEPWGVQRLYP